MATLKHSKQRDAIKTFVMSRTDHPTAEAIYQNVSMEFPKISLGTVYRNLSLLVEHGEIITVPSEDGSAHYDANLAPHYHFLCNKCGAIKDVMLSDEAFENLVIKTAQKAIDFGTVLGHETFFHGICDNCK